MFKHLFINKLKVLLKRKEMLFWTLIFPFLLGAFFYIALSNVGKDFNLEIIPIAIVDNEYYRQDNILNEVISNCF